jgi:hypothetical protein
MGGKNGKKRKPRSLHSEIKPTKDRFPPSGFVRYLLSLFRITIVLRGVTHPRVLLQHPHQAPRNLQLIPRMNPLDRQLCGRMTIALLSVRSCLLRVGAQRS